MTEEEKKQALAEWIASRPESVQRLAAEFPLGTVFDTGKGRWYLVGWTENDSLIVSRVDPRRDYEGAMNSKQYLCASHFRPQCPVEFS